MDALGVGGDRSYDMRRKSLPGGCLGRIFSGHRVCRAMVCDLQCPMGGAEGVRGALARDADCLTAIGAGIEEWASD